MEIEQDIYIDAAPGVQLNDETPDGVVSSISVECPPFGPKRTTVEYVERNPSGWDNRAAPELSDLVEVPDQVRGDDRPLRLRRPDFPLHNPPMPRDEEAHAEFERAWAQQSGNPAPLPPPPPPNETTTRGPTIPLDLVDEPRNIYDGLARPLLRPDQWYDLASLAAIVVLALIAS